MRSSALRLALLPAILLICGCTSNNKGKIELTRWSSLAATVKGVALPNGALQLAFGGDGRMVMHINGASSAGGQTTFKGAYTLGFGDIVTLNLDQELAGRKTHVETIVINGDHLTMTDTDGTAVTFVKAK